MKLNLLLYTLIAIILSQNNIYPKKAIVAKKGDKVKVHYILKLKNGKIIDKSKNRGPFEFTIGTGQVIPGFDKAVINMKVGTQKVVTIPPQDGYGKWIKKLLAKINKNKFPKNFDLKIGKQISVKDSLGNIRHGKITKVNGNIVSIDFNHPLAGKNLIFTIKLLSIN